MVESETLLPIVIILGLMALAIYFEFRDLENSIKEISKKIDEKEKK